MSFDQRYKTNMAKYLSKYGYYFNRLTILILLILIGVDNKCLFYKSMLNVIMSTELVYESY